MTPPPWRRRLKLLASLVLTPLGLLTAAAVALDAWGHREPPPGTWDVIVVAGCRVTPDGEPSVPLRARVERAVALWEEGRAPRILFTGGLGDFPPTEAQAAASYAHHLGVPQDAILREDRSTSTEENARFAADLLPGARVLLVTDTYHVLRAQRVFAQHFPDVAATGATTPVAFRTQGALREVLAVAYYGLAGRL